MSTFLKNDQLGTALSDLIEQAYSDLILISPYIKLHHRYKTLLKERINDHKLFITIVFGKNEQDISKSIFPEDLEFFKGFPNIEIRYEPRLHAKYYANDSASIITSMNLYDYSQDQNIEAGVFLEVSFRTSIGLRTSSLESESFDFFQRVIDNSELLYERKPHYKSKLLGLKEEYIESSIVTDKFYTKNHLQTDESKSQTQSHSIKKSISNHSFGFCIRTGVQIPFNPERPFSNDGFKLWAKSKLEDGPEYYCHFSGERSEGQTSKIRPILRKNWSKAKDLIKK